jgi:hypothetical protein
MAMIATRISGDSRCHFAIRISTSVAAEACAAELPRLAPRPAAHSCVSSDVSKSCVPIANPPSSVRLRPEPLSVKPLRCADNSGHRGGFFVSGVVVGGSLGSESGASQFAPPATACRVLPPEAGEVSGLFRASVLKTRRGSNPKSTNHVYSPPHGLPLCPTACASPARALIVLASLPRPPRDSDVRAGYS